MASRNPAESSGDGEAPGGTPPGEDATTSRATEVGDEGMTLDELSAATGIPPRTIRYYQAEKLLQKPHRDRSDARVARYTNEHIERLALVAELRDRGLKLPAIRGLLEAGDTSSSVADWLGLEGHLRGSWGHDEPRIVSAAELTKMLEGTPPGTQGLLEDAGFFTRQGNSWLVPSEPLLVVSVDLVRNGVDVDVVVDATAILGKYLGKAADELIELFVEAVRHGLGSGVETSVMMDALRASAGEGARIVFGQQLERAIDELLADTKRLRR
ncbi:MAG: helix-turn-helix domain-containing protein [Microthrixaceae bacterium]